jgi:hypothetical protein
MQKSKDVKKDAKAGTKAAETRQQKQPISIKLTIIGCIILLITSPWILYIYNFVPGDDPEADLELEHYTQVVIDDLKNYAVSKTLELISSDVNFNSNIKTLEDILNNDLENTIRKHYQPHYLEQQKIEITVNYFDVKLELNFKTMPELDRYPSISSDEPRLELFLAGRYYDTTVPYSYTIIGDLELTAQQLSGSNGAEGGFIKRNLDFEQAIQTPHLFIDYKLQQFQDQAQTAYSDLGRIMNYMLTTLARMRAYTIRDFGSNYTHKNILNEGDIELCLNLALILEEALLFGGYDHDSINAIDRYFYNADDTLHSNNPTGRRIWGSAEELNYDEYKSRKSVITDDGSRLLSTLVSKYLTQGIIDPADLMGLYLIMDQGPRPAIIDSPSDTVSILQARYGTSYLMDPRDVTDPADPTNLQYIIPLQGKTESLSDSKNNYELVVDQQPNYLVLGADFKTIGLEDPRPWHTTGKLRDQGRGTRTASVVPKKPADHDYRLDWQLNIQGKFSLSLVHDNEFSNPWFDGKWLTREIEFNFPVKVYVWFRGIPNINSLDSDNFNVGQFSKVQNGWIITTESHLVEYFEHGFWKYLKPMSSLGFDVSNSVLSYMIANQGLEYRPNGKLLFNDKSTIPDNAMISNWINDILLFQAQSLEEVLTRDLDSLWLRFDTFMDLYFMDYLRQYNPEYGFYNFTEPQFPHDAFLPWISVLGHEVTLFFDFRTNVLEVRFIQPNGYVEIQLEGFNTSKEQLKIVLTNHIELPGIITLTSTTTSPNDDNAPTKPAIFMDGMLFDKYTITTRTHSRPDIVTGTRESDTLNTEQLLISRAKFGDRLYHVDTVEFSEITLGPESQYKDMSIKLDFFVPENEKQNVDELELGQVLLNVLGSEPIDDEYILNREYTSRSIHAISTKLLDWYNGDSVSPKLAIGLSIASRSLPNPYSSANLTIFLTEPQSTESFIRWFGENGLELVLALGSTNNLNRELASVFMQSNDFMTPEDIKNIDFELSINKLELGIQNEMNIGENLIDQYEFSASDRNNLVLIQVISGIAMVELVLGAEVDSNQDGNNGNLITYSQVYYCYQDSVNNVYQTHLLLGTDIFATI